jgi:hypothetical protein
MGASLLVLANKRDLPNCMSLEDIEKVITFFSLLMAGSFIVLLSNSSLKDISLQRHNRRECPGGFVLVGSRYR